MDDVEHHLEEEISSGRLKTGTKLDSERRLAERFGVGRPAVREALKRLEERGLIDTQSGRGSFVREVQVRRETDAPAPNAARPRVSARQVSHARKLLESEAAALAAESRTDEQVAHLRELLQVFEDGGGVDDLCELDIAIHEGIVIASNNIAIQTMYWSIRALVKALMLRSLSDRAVMQVGSPMHHTILDAIDRRDPEAARQAMMSHISVAETHYGPDLDVTLAEVLRRRALRLPASADVLRAVGHSRDEIDPA
jgi:GntR family transcriptional regulator, transcriptional repressor for pyruvate dehydrogenase complex